MNTLQLVPYAGTTRIRFNGIRFRDLSLSSPLRSNQGTPTRWEGVYGLKLGMATQQQSIRTIYYERSITNDPSTISHRVSAQQLQQCEHHQPGNGATSNQRIQLQ